jgi:hypothetical protein
MTETAMCWGFDCGNGWFHILDALCGNIQSHIDWKNSQRENAIKYNSMIDALQNGDSTLFDEYYKDSGIQPGAYLEQRRQEAMTTKHRDVGDSIPQVTVDQVKEKFGTLRFYYTGGDDYISGLVSMAESMSARTCESCGTPAETNWPTAENGGIGGWVRTICEPCSIKQEQERQRYLDSYQKQKENKNDNNYQFIGEDSGSHD